MENFGLLGWGLGIVLNFYFLKKLLIMEINWFGILDKSLLILFYGNGF